MKKKQTPKSQKDDWKELEHKVAKHTAITLGIFTMFGKKATKTYPEKLFNLGIFQDTAFQSFLISFYEASRLLGPEMAVRNNGQKPRGKVITMDDFNQLVNAAMLAAMFSAPWSQKEVEHVKTILESNPEVIGSFLYEFADGLITMERAKALGK